MTDKAKIAALCVAMGYDENVKVTDRYIIVPEWGRRFVFNEAQEMERVQDIYYVQSGVEKGQARYKDARGDRA